MARLDLGHGVKLANPALKGTCVRYEGSLENFTRFESQLENYGRLRASLEPLGVELNWIWAGYYERPADANYRPVSRSFIAVDQRRNVVWQKYESAARGTGQNYFFLFGNRLKLSYWLDKLTADQRVELYERARHCSLSGTKFQ